MAREIATHEQWLGPWTDRGRAPVLVHGDVDERLSVTTYLPGRLVQGDPAADDLDI